MNALPFKLFLCAQSFGTYCHDHTSMALHILSERNLIISIMVCDKGKYSLSFYKQTFFVISASGINKMVEILSLLYK